MRRFFDELVEVAMRPQIVVIILAADLIFCVLIYALIWMLVSPSEAMLGVAMG